MSKLDAAARNALPASTFAGSNRSYPIPDAGHARAALSRVSHAEKVGSVSPSEASHIRAKAHRKLAHENGGMAHGDPRATAQRIA